MLVNDDPLKEAVKTYEAPFSDDVITQVADTKQ